MIRESRLLAALVLLPLCAQLMFIPAVRAQDEKAAATPAEEKKPEVPAQPLAAPALKVTVDSDEKDPTEAWKALLARKLAIFEQLQALKKKFATAATSEEKRTVRDQYVDLIREFEISVYPEMLELAAKIYAKDEGELDAGEIVMKEAFNNNDFDRSAEVSSKLLAADRKTKDVVSMGAVSQFALHNFEQASAIFAEAQKMNRLDLRYETYIDSAKKYQDLWKTEQELRAKEDALAGDAALPRIQFQTSKGKIVFELFEDHAPNTVANSISLIEDGKYDGISFHRVMNGFMAQGGDPNTLDDDPGNDGYGGPGYSIKCECYEEGTRMHFRGSLSMAHTGPDTGGSQFFITHLPTDWLNARTEPDKGGHTVFGRVIDGMKVVASIKRGDKITKATVLRKRPHEYKPEITPDEKPEEATEESSKDESSNEDASKDDSSSEDASKGESSKDDSSEGDAKTE
jgi:peptidyl-prolyl cis-trans isomerase B (cyclophilin B)